ncbi:MAG: hypothetical protein AB1758_10560 [Candidatus Eremiobacterota bacterium]
MKRALKVLAALLGVVGFAFACTQVWFATFTVSDRAQAARLYREAVENVRKRDRLAADPDANGFLAVKDAFYDRSGSHPLGQSWSALKEFTEAERKVDYAALARRPSPEFTEARQKFQSGLPELNRLLSSPNILWDSEWDKGPRAAVPNYILMRYISRGLAGHCEYLLAVGRTHEALNYALLSLHFGGKVGQQGGSLTFMVAIALHAKATDCLANLVMSGRLDRAECEEVVRQVDVHGFGPDLFVQRADEEYASWMEAVDFIRRPHAGNPVGSVMAGSMYWYPGLLERDRRILQQFYLEDRPYAVSVAELPRTLQDEHERVMTRSHAEAAQLIYSDLSSVSGTYRKALARNGALKVLAALQLHRMDHGGYPGRLEDLAPSILAELPKDWTSPDGRFRYELKAGQVTLGSGGDASLQFYPVP